MEAMLPHAPLNSAQLFVLQTFATMRNEADREELTSLYLDFLQRKLDAETNRLWEEGKLNDSVFDEILQTHCRTPYNK